MTQIMSQKLNGGGWERMAQVEGLGFKKRPFLGQFGCLGCPCKVGSICI